MGHVRVHGADVSDGRIAQLRVKMHKLPARTIDRDTAIAWMKDGHSLVPVVDGSPISALQLVDRLGLQLLRMPRPQEVVERFGPPFEGLELQQLEVRQSLLDGQGFLPRDRPRRFEQVLLPDALRHVERIRNRPRPVDNVEARRLQEIEDEVHGVPRKPDGRAPRRSRSKPGGQLFEGSRNQMSVFALALNKERHESGEFFLGCALAAEPGQQFKQPRPALGADLLEPDPSSPEGYGVFHEGRQ